MFIGHYAVGLASRHFAPRASIGALMAAPILLDLLWPIFLLLGWEHVSIVSSHNPFLRLQFDWYPVSHGLVAVVGWATLFASFYFGFTRYVAGALVVWVGVVSHWLLDYVVHARDLPLYSGSRLFGLGLWNHVGVTIAIEVAMFTVGIWLYTRQTTAKDKSGSYGFWVFVIALLLAYGAALFGPSPKSVKALAIGTLFTLLFVLWAWWFGTHREATLQNPKP
jgi:hypothetical protein